MSAVRLCGCAVVRYPLEISSEEFFLCSAGVQSVAERRQESGSMDCLLADAVRYLFLRDEGLFLPLCLQNAMTSSEERASAEVEGCRIERSLMDCVAPP